MIGEVEIKEFLLKKNYDLRITGNARWIDQKCTPDVLWSISDFVLNYIEEVENRFTPKDIWLSDYAKETIAETYSKPGTTEKSAEKEYNKVFSQPLSLLCYAGVIEDISVSNRHVYRVIEKDILEYISRNDIYAMRFLIEYIEKVIRDSELFEYFEQYFCNQDKCSFNLLKEEFIKFYHEYTPVKKDYEPKRIFTKVINPLAFKYNKKGTEKGRVSKHIIKKSDMMYNRDNFIDIYKDKPKEITRQEWVAQNFEIDVNNGYFTQKMNHAKRKLKKYISKYHNNLSEMTRYCVSEHDIAPATQIHHIFPASEYPEIKYFTENLIAITPNQHFIKAHPDNNTNKINQNIQKELLMVKIASINDNLTNQEEEHIYEFDNFLKVLSIGLDNNEILLVKKGDYKKLLHYIDIYYENKL